MAYIKFQYKHLKRIQNIDIHLLLSYIKKQNQLYQKLICVKI